MAEAIGFEEMIRRSREQRHAETTAPAVTKPVAVAENEITSIVNQANRLFSLPNHTEFENFFKELNSLIPNFLTATLQNDMPGNYTLTMSTPTYNLNINLRTVIEMIAQLMHTPLSMPMELKIKTPPPFISNIKDVCNFWISEMLCEYQKIFRLNDPIVQKLCHEYWLSMSYPLLVRLAYVEWENKQMDWKVGLKVKDIAAEFTAKNRQIQSDYEKKLDTETTILKTKHNRTEMENQALKTQVNMINERYNNLKQDEKNRVGEVEDAHNKLKDEKTRVSLLEKENIRLQKEITEANKKLKAAEETEWRKDFTYTTEHPVFVNALDDTIIDITCSMGEFIKNYKPGKVEGASRRYIFGDKSVLIPLSLALKIPKLIAEPVSTTTKGAAEKNEKAKESPGRPPTQQKIIEFITSNQERTIEDISTAIDVAANHLYEHMKTLVDDGTIIKKHSDERGGNVYSMSPL